jgi:hypothetical protein
MSASASCGHAVEQANARLRSPVPIAAGGFRAVAVNVVNGGRDQIVINETAEGPPGVVDQIDRIGESAPDRRQESSPSKTS